MNNFTYIAYLVAAVCFIMALRGLSSPVSARQFAGATNSFTSFAHTFLGRFLVMLAHFHFAIDSFTLHFLFQNAQSLIYVVITNKNFNHEAIPPSDSMYGLFKLEAQPSMWLWTMASGKLRG
jgi:hypothetical protein